MVIIIGIWIVLSVAALITSTLAAWRVRRWGSILRYVIAALVGSTINYLVAATLAVLALPSAAQISPVPFGTVLLTIGFAAQTIPMIALALSLLHLFGGRPPEERKG